MPVPALLVFAAAASASPVWITSQESAGVVISWNKATQNRELELVVETGEGSKTHKLDRPSGTIIVPLPAPPYRVSYRSQGGPTVKLASEGAPTQQAAAAVAKPEPEPSKPQVRSVRVRFNVGPEQATLRMPAAPTHLKQQIRKPKSIDLFIKVNPDGVVTGTSSPRYPDETRRELARLASETAMKEWRFKPVRKVNNTYPYRDARVQLSFYGSGASMRARSN